MAAKFKLVGAAQMRAKLTQLAKRFPTEIEMALRQQTEFLVTVCKKETPVDTGALRGSIHVEGPERHGRTITISIVAGGVAAPYALFVHENMRATHKVGGPKYIERPLMAAVPLFGEAVARQVDLNRAMR